MKTSQRLFKWTPQDYKEMNDSTPLEYIQKHISRLEKLQEMYLEGIDSVVVEDCLKRSTPVHSEMIVLRRERTEAIEHWRAKEREILYHKEGVNG